MVRHIPLFSLRGIVFLAFFVAVLIPVGASAADDPPPPAMKVQSTEEALQFDAQTIAADRGWSEAAALDHLKRQAVTGAFVAELAETYPDTFSGAWTGDGPNGRLFVRFIGQIPRAAQKQAKQQGIVVAFVGGAKQSLIKLEARAHRVHAELVEHGYPQVATGFLVQEQRIVATATRAQGDKRPDQELRDRLSSESRASDVEITFAEGPIVRFNDTYGGDRIFNSTTGETYTSRITVHEGTTKGENSAGHCAGTNTYQQHRGTWGAVESYTTPTSTVFPRFYSDFGDGRDTVAVAGLLGTTACTSTTSPSTLAPTHDGQKSPWGPLAVVDEPVTAALLAGLGPGTLRIGTDCVTLQVDGFEPSTLIWRGAEVTWDSSAREIVFASWRDGELRLSDGETITVGGTSSTNPNPRWLATPAARCPAAQFAVHDVIR